MALQICLFTIAYSYGPIHLEILLKIVIKVQYCFALLSHFYIKPFRMSQILIKIYTNLQIPQDLYTSIFVLQ